MTSTLIGVGVTVLLALAGLIYSYGRNVQAMTTLIAELAALKESGARDMAAVRETLGRFGERVGRLEVRDEVERELSGRVRGNVG